MKRHTLVNSLFSSKALLILASVAVPTFAHAAQTDISNTPLATGVSAAVKPNILYVLDDSGSMADDFMPDEVINSGSCKRSRSSSADNTGATTCRQGEPPYYAAEYNGLYYDPQIAYLPGLNADGTSKASFGSPWTAVKVNAYTSASTINLTNSYPEIVLCNSNGADVNDSTQCKRNGINGTDPNGHGAYAFPNNTVGAPVVHYNSYGVGVNKITAGTFAIRKTRNANPFYYTITPSEFCNSSKLTVCVASALPTGAFTFPAQLRFCSSNAAAWAAPGNIVANNVAVPTCQAKRVGSFTLARYGSFTRVDIVASTPSYGGRPNRSDCAARPVCTFTEEMTNFANWYAYYRTRIQMMKSATGFAFNVLSSSYRVGFMTINPGSPISSSKFLAINDFDTTQKGNWYTKLYAQIPGNSTPLRQAISTAGRYYAHKAISGISDDPIQYSCQQNFTILTTDGYWNGSNGVELNGSTAISNYDNVLGTGAGQVVRPIFDGGASGESATLADVAQYYYINDLRTSGSVALNNVPPNGDDNNSQQHMTTFTMGLGVDGILTYDPNYKKALSGDFFDITQGTKNWPKPSSSNSALADDLWHAAVNGRGTYFSAKNPTAVADSLAAALAGVSAQTGAAAAAATSSLEPVAGDNFAYVANYRTVKWDGDIEARTIDLNTGVVSTAASWEAQTQINGQVGAATDTRNIFTFTNDTATFGSGKLKSFTFANLTASEQTYFGAASGQYVATLTQYPAMTAAQKAAAVGSNLVDFIRGRTGKQGFDNTPDVNKLYRSRDHALGDIVNAQPVFVKAPFFNYSDPFYAGSGSFQVTNSTRTPIVYVAANDGMLHALNANTGTEQWAYIPSMVLPKLFRLADEHYDNLHEYYVDGSPTAGDICSSNPCASANNWRTILVGGLNAGGKGYYALDVTDPANPKALWEFTQGPTCYVAGGAPDFSDCNLGFSYGNPLIVKRGDGKWVVIVTSGYNNVSATPFSGDGVGYLYVLDAVTGEILDKISTGVGDATTPSGLGKISGWVDDPTHDNTALRVYGGDLQGNVWRFDINNNIPPAGKEAFRITTLKDASNNIQPITTRPELALVNSKAVVYVATGRYIGTSDLSDTRVQSLYAIKDTLGTTTISNIRATGTGSLVKQTITNGIGSSGAAIRTVTNNSVNLNNDGGWFVDLPDSGERVNVEMKLQLGTLIVASNVPDTNACDIGGYSWLNYFGYATGSYVPGTDKIGQKFSNSLLVGINVVRLPNGKVVVIGTAADNTRTTVEAPFSTNLPTGKRVNWREILE